MTRVINFSLNPQQLFSLLTMAKVGLLTRGSMMGVIDPAEGAKLADKMFRMEQIVTGDEERTKLAHTIDKLIDEQAEAEQVDDGWLGDVAQDLLNELDKQDSDQLFI